MTAELDVDRLVMSADSLSDPPRRIGPEYERYIEYEGGVRRLPARGQDPSAEQLRALHQHMVIARAVDQEAIYLQRQGHLGVYASSRGQEAAQVGSAAALATSDWLFPSYREMGAAIVRGLPPESILHSWRGTWFAAHDVREHRFGLLTIPLATQAPHAVGLAFASKQDGHGDVVLCYLGDGATSEGDAHEAFNFASVFEVPVVFLIQNNQYAISVPLAKQTRASSLALKGGAYGMPGYRCDGNDVVAVHAATKEAVCRARAGEGPSIVEAVTYRMEPHTTSDDPQRYRTTEETASWAALDPITRLEEHLQRAGILDADGSDRATTAAATEATRVRHEIEHSPQAEPSELFEHVLARPSAQLDRQREEVERAFGS